MQKSLDLLYKVHGIGSRACEDFGELEGGDLMSHS